MTNKQSTRINRYLASCGIGSRRSCDDLIRSGKIRVNGEICQEPSTQIIEGDSVKFGNKLVKPLDIECYLFNKPRGVVCTKSDEKNRQTIYDVLPKDLHHLNHVGRLDADSEGLLIITNDGELAQKLTHPKTKIEKEYLVTLNQAIKPEEAERLLKGLHLPMGFAKAQAIARVSPRRLRLILTTGLKRQIREMFQAIGFRVEKLVRVRVGALWGGDLAPGACAPLGSRDIALLCSNPPLTKEFRNKPAVKKRAAKKTARKGAKRGPKKGR